MFLLLVADLAVYKLIQSLIGSADLNLEALMKIALSLIQYLFDMRLQTMLDLYGRNDVLLVCGHAPHYHLLKRGLHILTSSTGYIDHMSPLS